MTVIVEHVEYLGGVDDSTVFSFSSPMVRDSDDDTALITKRAMSYTASNGVLTTDDLDPGPATVTVGVSSSFQIAIPDSPTPIRLWPLIQAGLPVPPAQMATAVINGGGAAMIRVMTADEYAALVSSTTPDPGSIFYVY